MAFKNNLPHDTPIFLDSRLDDGVRGETFAPLLRAAGFKRIFLSTSDVELHQTQLPGIDGVIDKNFDLALEIARSERAEAAV